MSRRPRNFNIQTEFMKHVKKNPVTKCWDWDLELFRFRVNIWPTTYILNPRRYCAYIHGYNIQLGRQVTHGHCGNAKCVNPEHTLLKHNRRMLSKDTPLYFSIEELRVGSNAIRHYYGRTMHEMRMAREATVKLIVRIRQEPVRRTIEEIADKYDIGPGFVREVKQLTVKDFNENLKVDHNDTGVDPLDERGEELPHDAAHFFA